MKQLVVVADDFGLSEAVNEGVERGFRDGILTSASLMVAGPAAADAVRRARALPGLRVGLHIVVIEGPAVLPRSEIPALLDAQGAFPAGRGGGQIRLAMDYFARPSVQRQLAAEIRAQFAAFRATGLRLDHANAHKHMHLHPTVGRLLIDIGREFGLTAMRVPREPPLTLRACGTPVGVGAGLLAAWSGLLRRQARAAGLCVPDQVFGIAWSGHVTASRLQRLAPVLPEGLSELYMHPAALRDATLTRLMPDYEHVAELAALLDPDVAAAFRGSGVQLTSYAALVG